ncbi:unnamed protein product, partial [Phaeothamnion confervicola]
RVSHSTAAKPRAATTLRCPGCPAATQMGRSREYWNWPRQFRRGFEWTAFLSQSFSTAAVSLQAGAVDACCGSGTWVDGAGCTPCPGGFDC